MNKKNVLELHHVLKDAKLKGMKTESKMIVLTTLRKTTPIAQQYEEALKTAQEKFKPEGFDDLMQKARENEGKPEAERTISRDEIDELNRMSTAFNQEMSAFINELNNEEEDIVPAKLPKDEFGKFMEANDFEASKLMLIPVEE